MKKSILFIMLCAFFLTGCGDDIPLQRVNLSGSLLCINGHLYKKYGSYEAAIPIFDYASDTPILIQCKDANGKLFFDKTKILGGE